MTNDLHDRARALIRRRWIEELDAPESAWLEQHLGECPECAAAAAKTQAAVSALRSVPVSADAAMVERTRARVAMRARELREADERRRVLVISSVASFISGGITLPLLWRLFAWIGSEVALPDPVWQAGFVVFVVLPGLLGGIALLTRRPAADFVHLRGAGE